MQNIQYKKLSLEELVILSQKNDLQALEELLRREQKNIYTLFSYLSNCKNNISDWTQEALLRVAQKINTLKNPKSFHSWLNHIITNLYYDELRKQKRKPDIVPMNESISSQITDTKCKPIEKCMLGELECVIKNEIQNLPEQFKIAIVLRELQGLSYEQIAYATNTNVGTVKSRIARGREKLQDSLKSYL